MTTKPTQCAQGYDCDACKGIEGMTLRDWFAGMAMLGTLSNCAACINAETGEQANKTPSLVASFAYQYADAMLKEREK